MSKKKDNLIKFSKPKLGKIVDLKTGRIESYVINKIDKDVLKKFVKIDINKTIEVKVLVHYYPGESDEILKIRAMDEFIKHVKR